MGPLKSNAFDLHHSAQRMDARSSAIAAFMRDKPFETHGTMGMLLDEVKGGATTAVAPRPASTWDTDVAVRPVSRMSVAQAQRAASRPNATQLAQHEKTVTDLKRKRRCVQCSRFYTESTNIGQWNCRYHPLQLGDDARRLCCSGTKRSLGCVECDHTESRETYSAATPLLLLPRFFLNSSEAVAAAPIRQSILEAENVEVVMESSQWVHQDIRHPDDVRTNQAEEAAYVEYIKGMFPVFVQRANHYGLPVDTESSSVQNK